MVVIAGESRLLGFGRRDAAAEVDRLYRKHADEVLRYAFLVLRSRPDAEDVVQATWIRAFRAIGRGERVQKPRNWLIKIAHNECRRLLANRSRRAVEVELDEIPVEQPEAGRAEALRSALQQLAPKQREALVLRELEGRSYAEIAELLEMSDSAVETLLFRARRAVREQMENGLGCDEAALLIAADELSDEDRGRVRAHVRACAECATLERQARGRKSALRRLASSLGFPWFGKTLAVGLGGAAIGVTAVAVAEPHPVRAPQPAPLRVQAAAATVRPASPVVARREPARVPVAARAVAGHPPPLRHTVSLKALQRQRPAAAPKVVVPAPAETPKAAPEPATTERPEPQPPVAPAVAPPTAKTPVTLPKLTVPTVPTVPTVTVPAVTTPAVTTPTVSVPVLPVEVPPVTVPAVTTPVVTTPTVTLPVPTPQVPGLPSVP